MSDWTLERIYARCDDLEDGCMLWKGGMVDRRYPVLQVPDESRPHGQRQVYVRRLVWRLSRGVEPKAPPKWVLVAKCGHDRCVAQDCLQVISKATRLRQAAETGVFNSIAFRAKVAAGKRRESLLSDAAVAEIQASDEPGQVLAARYGISKGYALALRAGRSRQDYTSPLAALLPRAGWRP